MHILMHCFRRLIYQGLNKMVDIYQATFSNAFTWIKMPVFIQISLNIVSKVIVINKEELVQVMVWDRTGKKSLNEPMLVYW